MAGTRLRRAPTSPPPAADAALRGGTTAARPRTVEQSPDVEGRARSQSGYELGCRRLRRAISAELVRCRSERAITKNRDTPRESSKRGAPASIRSSDRGVCESARAPLAIAEVPPRLHRPTGQG